MKNFRTAELQNYRTAEPEINGWVKNLKILKIK